MNIENINLNNISDPGASEAISRLTECVFELNRELKRAMNNLTSQNVKEIDFNITRVKNIDLVLTDYAKKE